MRTCIAFEKHGKGLPSAMLQQKEKNVNVDVLVFSSELGNPDPLCSMQTDLGKLANDGTV